ncbi:carboxymuconolactone decarboxylase family protein [Microbacterium protaetiae]|uniref:carboxymuconolactone decarboxylase family protein n=1 Tax=Microbacterium protaetiae TaxID=2509458 RepID=UPI0013E9E84F|nr:carboxymuconolactone decarboxylase family protein [Microbacterium protaetiae]
MAASAVGAEGSVQARLRRLVGTLDASWQAALEVDEDFLAAYVDLAEVPASSTVLDPKSRALIALAVSAAVTTLDDRGIRTAAVQAREAGASLEETLEAVHLVSVLGVHTLATGFPLLSDVMAQRGRPLVDDAPLTPEQAQIRADFESRRGYWSDLNEIQVRMDPAWFRAYTAFSSHPWLNGSLSPKLRELIYIAIDLSPTHLFTAGVRPHIENALRYGATAAELIETLEVTALVGISSLRAAVLILCEVFDEG